MFLFWFRVKLNAACVSSGCFWWRSESARRRLAAYRNEKFHSTKVLTEYTFLGRHHQLLFTTEPYRKRAFCQEGWRRSVAGNGTRRTNVWKTATECRSFALLLNFNRENKQVKHVAEEVEIVPPSDRNRVTALATTSRYETRKQPDSNNTWTVVRRAPSLGRICRRQECRGWAFPHLRISAAGSLWTVASAGPDIINNSFAAKKRNRLLCARTQR